MKNVAHCCMNRKYIDSLSSSCIPAPPKFQTTPSDRTVLKGTNAVFTCTATGDPNPTITWTYEGGQLPTNSQEDTSTGTLTITSVTNDDKNEGMYTCTATNPLKSINATAKLTVQGKKIVL